MPFRKNNSIEERVWREGSSEVCLPATKMHGGWRRGFTGGGAPATNRRRRTLGSTSWTSWWRPLLRYGGAARRIPCSPPPEGSPDPGKERTTARWIEVRRGRRPRFDASLWKSNFGFARQCVCKEILSHVIIKDLMVHSFLFVREKLIKKEHNFAYCCVILTMMKPSRIVV
jgi:hypothetical protein